MISDANSKNLDPRDGNTNANNVRIFSKIRWNYFVVLIALALGVAPILVSWVGSDWAENIVGFCALVSVSLFVCATFYAWSLEKEKDATPEQLALIRYQIWVFLGIMFFGAALSGITLFGSRLGWLAGIAIVGLSWFTWLIILVAIVRAIWKLPPPS